MEGEQEASSPVALAEVPSFLRLPTVSWTAFPRAPLAHFPQGADLHSSLAQPPISDHVQVRHLTGVTNGKNMGFEWLPGDPRARLNSRLILDPRSD